MKFTGIEKNPLYSCKTSTILEWLLTMMPKFSISAYQIAYFLEKLSFTLQLSLQPLVVKNAFFTKIEIRSELNE